MFSNLSSSIKVSLKQWPYQHKNDVSSELKLTPRPHGVILAYWYRWSSFILIIAPSPTRAITGVSSSTTTNHLALWRHPPQSLPWMSLNTGPSNANFLLSSGWTDAKIDVEMANLATKPPSRDNSLAARLAI